MNIISKENNPREIDYREGAIVLIDKPLEWTSFDVVNKLRFALKTKYDIKKIKVGHNGTLDPLATGLLMIFTGKYTKRIPNEDNHDKTYEGIIKLGATTDSLDTETIEKDVQAFNHIIEADIKDAMSTFLGKSNQEIPFYSATKVKGQRMYKMARQGKVIEKKFKEVVFHTIELTNYEAPFVHFKLSCGKGTYVRAFARDLGIKLKTTAYLYKLRRTEISNYSVNNAFDINSFCNNLNS